MTEKLTLDEVLNSKVFVRPNSAITFKEPSAYIDPFTRILEKDPEYSEARMLVRVSDPVINQNANGEKNIAYPRVGLEYMHENFEIGDMNFHSVVGFIYSLDSGRPVMKVYSGINVTSCLNLNIWNADQIHEVDLFGDSSEMYEKAVLYFENSSKEKFKSKYEKLITHVMGETEFHETLGNMRSTIIRNKTPFNIQLVGNAEKLLFSPSSKYYVGDQGSVQTTRWNVLNAMTQSISNDTEFILRPNKTLSLFKIFNN